MLAVWFDGPFLLSAHTDCPGKGHNSSVVTVLSNCSFKFQLSSVLYVAVFMANNVYIMSKFSCLHLCNTNKLHCIHSYHGCGIRD